MVLDFRRPGDQHRCALKLTDRAFSVPVGESLTARRVVPCPAQGAHRRRFTARLTRDSADDHRQEANPNKAIPRSASIQNKDSDVYLLDRFAVQKEQSKLPLAKT